ncbi:MAG: hypothetical protein PHC52_12855 [Syntrophales bacterium]|nr:hypothetical protein [Syntrophales bacterium]
MLILAIDPGPTQSALLVYQSETKLIVWADILENADALKVCLGRTEKCPYLAHHLVVEMVESFGMAVGKEVFETVFWVGRFFQAWREGDGARHLVYRKQEKMHLCQSMRAKDTNIRQALIDMFPKTGKDGKGRPSAIGTKKAKGPLFRLHDDLWSALAVAVTWTAQQQAGKEQE